MRSLAVLSNTIPAMSLDAVAQVRRLETAARQLPQVHVDTEHLFHAGMYARTVMVPAGTMLTGALIKIATLLIVSGHAFMHTDGEPVEVKGYATFAASAGRKQAFVAITDTFLTMVFPTTAVLVSDAESEFTDEVDLLFSRGEA